MLFGAPLLDRLWPGYVIADKAYDADHFYKAIQATGAPAVIPPRPERRPPYRRECGWRLYRERNLVEHMFAKLKQFPGVATRYDKLFQSFRGLVFIAPIFLWLR